MIILDILFIKIGIKCEKIVKEKYFYMKSKPAILSIALAFFTSAIISFIFSNNNNIVIISFVLNFSSFIWLMSFIYIWGVIIGKINSLKGKR